MRYDIYGSDVTIANKMESGGKIGEINVSDRTKYWLDKTYPGLYRFEPHELIHTKLSDKDIQSYLIYANRNNDEEEIA